MYLAIGMGADLVWVIASTIYWTSLLISVKQGKEVWKRTRATAVIIGIITFFIGLCVTSPIDAMSLPLHTIFDVVVLCIIIIFIILLGSNELGIILDDKRRDSLAMIAFFLAFAFAVAAVVIRFFVLYIPYLQTI